MKVALGSDHGGFEHKEAIKKHLKKQGFIVKDFGTYSSDSIDYNDVAIPVSKAVVNNEFDRGVLLCGTGVGMSIMANKVKGIRCALVHDLFTAEQTRLHNDSNILAMGGRIISEDLALQITDIWLKTEFSQVKRHKRRVNKIDEFNGEE